MDPQPRTEGRRMITWYWFTGAFLAGTIFGLIVSALCTKTKLPEEGQS